MCKPHDQRYKLDKSESILAPMILRAWVVVAIGMLIGCVDKRPIYVAPELPADQIVTLKGGFAFEFLAVDGVRIDWKERQQLWQKTRLSPGTHTVRMVYGVGDGAYFMDITHTFVAGHEYLIGWKSQFWPGPQFLELTDRTSNTSGVVHERRN